VRGGGSGGCARSIARARVRSQSRVVALRHCRSHAHGSEKERRGIIKKTQTKTNNFAHARMRHFDKNKQKTKMPRYRSSAKWRLSQLRFWLRRHAGFHHNSHPTPNTETSAFHEPRLRCFSESGVLGDNSTVKTQPKWHKTEPLLKGQLLPRQNRIPLTQIHHSFS